jgi:hypothetical protein
LNLRSKFWGPTAVIWEGNAIGLKLSLKKKSCAVADFVFSESLSGPGTPK